MDVTLTGGTLQVGELCRRLGLPVREARYALERGLAPPGLDPHTDKGNHRQLSLGQAYWLAVLLALKASGLRAPAAARVAEFARVHLKGVTRQLNWDPAFSPFDGDLGTERRWRLDVGDARLVRVATDACPGGDVELPWADLETRKSAPDVRPVVTLRLDLSELAARLR